jgi:alpha-amylase
VPSIVLSLHAHLPLRLKKYSFFDIGHSQDYFDEEESRQVLERMAKDCCLPVNAAVLRLIRRHRGRFRVSCSVSGMLLEQLENGRKPLLESFRRLADTGCAEFPAGPWHHSLASFFSEEELRGQIALHRRKIRALFGQKARAFRNTELIYGNDVARIAESMGFRAILAGGAGRLPGCDAEVLHRPAGCSKLKVLFRHDRLSDQLALRPSGAEGRAVDADEFARRLADGYHADEIINLFMNYDAFIGHDQSKKGLPGFLETVSGVLLKRRTWRFLTPSDAAAEHEPAGQIDAPGPVFRADAERDGSAWLGNHLQIDAARTLYGLEDRVRATKSRKRIGTWRNLQASDYFCHMNTEDPASGAVQLAPNPFASPYDAYIHYMNILKDFSGRIAGKTGVRT